MQIECKVSTLDMSLYYINIYYCYKNFASDLFIAKILNISYEKYIEIMKSYNTDMGEIIQHRQCYFYTEEDCKKCIEDIKKKYNDRLVYLTLIENNINKNEVVDMIYEYRI
jgi:hypothetical protein